MTRTKLARSSLALLGSAIAMSVTAPAMAQSYKDFATSCAGTANVACIAQIGDFNQTTVDQTGAQQSKASVYIQGSNNGTGTIATIGDGRPVQLYKETVEIVPAASAPGKSDGHSQDGGKGKGDEHHQSDGKGNNAAPAPTTRLVFTAASRPLLLPANLPSGVIVQRGQRNTAEVAILGNNNDFYIEQEVGPNKARQSITGNNNLAVVIQRGAPGGNTASQAQNGSNNVAYVMQAGGKNIARLNQDDSSTILLEQENGFNTANLTQTGGANYLALRQTGGATISISQTGGDRIAIEQTAGMFGASGLSVKQY